MAAKKKAPLDITKLTGLKWEKFKPDTFREQIGKCSFCATILYDNSPFYEGYSPDTVCGCGCESPVVLACGDCGIKAGLEW